MADLIDRQAAIEAMLELQKEDDDAYGCHIPEAFHGERAAEALKSLPSAQPEKRTENTRKTLACDLIDRQAAIDEIEERKNANGYRNVAVISELNRLEGYIMRLPSAQPEAIPLEWIDKHLEWLDNCDNDFAQLAKVGIRAMVEIWKKDKT